MKNYKVVTLNACALALFTMSPANAAIQKWGSLSLIEKDVLKAHAPAWNNYTETRQHAVLKQSSSIIAGRNAWKTWLHKLSPRERNTLIENKKTMSDKEFKRHTDKLVQKYGKPFGHLK